MAGDFIKISDLDLSVLLDSVDYSRAEVAHGYRRQKVYESVAEVAPDLASVVDSVDLYDDKKGSDGESDLAKGALIAVKAIADFSHDANIDHDVRGEATASYLRDLNPDDLVDVFEKALDADIEGAEDNSAKLYTFIRDRLAASYPALLEFIPLMAEGHMHRSKEFRNGMWLGAIQLAVALDAMATREPGVMLPSEMGAYLNEGSVDPDDF